MRVIGAMLLAGTFLVGCATDPTASSARGADNGTLSEPIYYKDQLCTINFYGTNSPDAQTFFIWNLGIGSWLQSATYPTDARPDLYAVFAPRLERMWITAPMVFVTAGAVLGSRGLDWFRLAPNGEPTRAFTELTLADLKAAP